MRALKILVVVMGVLIVGGTVTLVTLIVQRAGGVFNDASTRVEIALDQPPGTRIAGIAAADAGGLAIWVQRPDGSEAVLLVDARAARLRGEIRPGGRAGGPQQ